jgi:hypothetical protein
MRKSILFLLIIVTALIAVSGCIKLKSFQPVSGHNQQSQNVSQNQDDDYFKPAELLAKRAVLYKLCTQEGDLAPFTAKADEIKSMNIPEVARQFNTSWWSISWGKVSLKPLPISDLTKIEADTFPLIAARLDDSQKENDWCLYTLSYDPDAIKVYIANAHSNWIPEERDFYLKGREQDCLQVWCARINGEWRILANLTCIGSVTPPEKPAVKTPPVSTANEEKEVH